LSGFWIGGPYVAGGSDGACFECDQFVSGVTLEFCRSGRLLWFSEGLFWRLRDAFEERGEDGLICRRRGRVSARASDEAEAAWVAEMSRTRYFVVRTKHFHEQIVGMPTASVKPRWLYQARW